MDILAVTHHPEINIKTFCKLNSVVLTLFVAWNKNLVRFLVKRTFMPLLRRFLDYSALHEIETLLVSKWNEHSCRHESPVSKIRRFWACSLHEIRPWFVSKWNGHSYITLKLTFKSFSSWNRRFWTYMHCVKLIFFSCFKLHVSKSLRSPRADPLLQ